MTDLIKAFFEGAAIGVGIIIVLAILDPVIIRCVEWRAKRAARLATQRMMARYIATTALTVNVTTEWDDETGSWKSTATHFPDVVAYADDPEDSVEEVLEEVRGRFNQ